MADPLSVMYLVLSVVQVTQNAYNLVNSIKHVSTRIDQQCYRLLAEKETTEAWANQMRLAAGDDLRSSVPPEKYDQVIEILEKLQVYYAKAEVKYSKVGAKTSKDGGEKGPGIRARTSYVLSGYNELKDLVDTISTMNTALRAIAPPLPPYAVPMYEGPQRPPTFASTFSARSHDRLAPSVSARSAGSSTAIPASSLSQTLVDDDRSLSPGGRDNPSNDDYAHLPRLSTIYSLLLEALEMLATHRKEDLLQNSAARLKLWGAGLFEQPAPLDQVLAKDDANPSATRQAFLKTAAHIFILEERALNGVGEKATRSINTKLTTMHTEISSILGTDELIDIALEKWAQYMEEKALIEKYGKPEQTSRDKVTKSSETYNAYQESGLDDAKRDMNWISLSIEVLFDLLPAIRAEKRQYAVDKELEERERSVEQPVAVVVDDAESTLEDIDKIEDFIRRRDRRAAEQGRKVTPLEPVFRKQRDRLEELRALGNRQKPGLSKSTKSVETAKERERRLQVAKAVASFAKEITSTGGMEQPPAPPVKKPSETKAGVDVKKPIEDPDSQADEQLTAFLKSLREVSF